MSINFILTALSVISIVTGFIVEGIKKLLNNTKIKFSSNLLAAIVSVLITVASSVGYVVLSKIEFSALVIIEIIVMAILSFLVSTVGYDKVEQMIKQITSKKKSDTDDKSDNSDEQS